MGSGWIGVDLDATLAEYGTGSFQERAGTIGPPIPKMLARVKRWLAEGTEVRIVTARVAELPGVREAVEAKGLTFVGADEARQQVEEWCLEHVGRVLPVTCVKDFRMIQLWDDRAVQVRPNTGEIVGECKRCWKGTI